jgi:hypothetical protein
MKCFSAKYVRVRARKNIEKLAGRCRTVVWTLFAKTFVDENGNFLSRAYLCCKDSSRRNRFAAKTVFVVVVRVDDRSVWVFPKRRTNAIDAANSRKTTSSSAKTRRWTRPVVRAYVAADASYPCAQRGYVCTRGKIGVVIYLSLWGGPTRFPVFLRRMYGEKMAARSVRRGNKTLYIHICIIHRPCGMDVRKIRVIYTYHVYINHCTHYTQWGSRTNAKVTRSKLLRFCGINHVNDVFVTLLRSIRSGIFWMRDLRDEY